MNKTLKKTLSIILAILMIATTIPFAFAAEETTNPWESATDGNWYYDAGEYEMCADETCRGVYVNGVCNVCGSKISTQIQNGWNQQNDNWYYYNDEGEYVTGWQQINGEWYYFDPETGALNEEITSSADTGTLYIECVNQNNTSILITVKDNIGAQYSVSVGNNREKFLEGMLNAVAKFLNETKNLDNYFTSEMLLLTFTEFGSDAVLRGAEEVGIGIQKLEESVLYADGDGISSPVIYHKMYRVVYPEDVPGILIPVPTSGFAPGETVTLKILPDKGYRMDEVIVVAKGDPSVRIEVTKADEFIYTFIMPHTDIDTRYTTFVLCDHSDNTNTPIGNTDGTHSFTCSVCSATVTEAHSGGTATCVSGAVCEICGESYGELDADNHDIVIDEAVAPTCTETGLTEGSHCTRCDDATVAQEVIPATNHKDTLVQVEAKAPTCTEIGWDAYEYCTACVHTTYVEIPASHDIVIDEAVTPTCTETGLTEGSHCSRCDNATVAQEVIPATNHKDTLVQVEAKAPTCTEIGWDAYEYCTECCEYTTYKEIPSNGHTPLEAAKENEVAPKCGVAGSYDLVVYCDVCGEEIDRDTVAVDALTHTDTDGDYLCDNGCGHEFPKPVDPTPDTPDEPADDTCDHICHSNNALVKFLWKIISFLQRLFGIQQYCDCGVLHYDAPIFG